jgi:NAD(P)H-hydrate epimerase
MENAGAGAARAIEAIIAGGASLPEPFRIICGPGKNGGDGFVVARHLRNAGLDVRIELAGRASYPPGSEAAVNLEIVRRLGIPLSSPDVTPATGPPPAEGTIIDAIFGTGLSRPLEPPFLDRVLALNSSGRPVVALDVPSGLDADTGEPLGAAVEAIHTLTFAAAKVGFTRGSGPRFTGNVQVIDIGLPRELWAPSP